MDKEFENWLGDTVLHPILLVTVLEKRLRETFEAGYRIGYDAAEQESADAARHEEKRDE